MLRTALDNIMTALRVEHAEIEKLVEEASVKLHEPVSDAQSLISWKMQLMALINAIAESKLSSLGSTTQRNSSLDPTDWPSARALAHEVLDSSLDHIQSISERPVSQLIPHDVRVKMEEEALPEQSQSLIDICRDTFTSVAPYTPGHPHPRFWGWVKGEGTFGGIVASMISASINAACGGSHHSGSAVERAVIGWMRQIFGFPQLNNGGLLTSGTSMATVLAMSAARRRALAHMGHDGLAHGPQLIVYASTETHGCIAKAAELLGLGSKAVHFVPVNDRFCIRIDELKVAIQEDKNKGLVPFFIVGNAGTVNTGAFDDLLELASVARAQDVWLHIDGAFGSLIILDPARRHLVNGIDQADSLAFDFHKWLHCPYDAGCVLVRDSTFLQSEFSANQPCLARTQKGCANGVLPFCDLGLELSRPFRALKVWFTLREHGTIKLGQKIADNCEQAQYLASLLKKHEPNIRVYRPVSLNIVNFRLEPAVLDKTDHVQIDQFNNDIVEDMQRSGVAVASTTRIRSRLYIRVCIVSHRSVHADFDLFVATLLNLSQIRLEKMQ